MANTKISLVANCLHPLVFCFVFFGLCCKELNFPRVVSKGDAKEMSIFSDERRVNCTTMPVQTLERLLNVAPKRTLALSHAHIHTRIETNVLETNKQKEAQARATLTLATVTLNPVGKFKYETMEATKGAPLFYLKTPKASLQTSYIVL